MINVSIAPAYDYGAQRKSRRAHSRYDEDDLEDLAPMLSGRMGKREEKEEVPFYKKVPPSMYAPYGPPRYEFVAPRKKSDWHIGPIGIGYFRYADEALIDYSDTDQSTFGGLFGSGGDSVKTGLSPLWFQKESFYGEELFENGETTPQEEGSAYNPYMATSTLKPTFEYMESAFLIGIHCRYQSCNTMFGFVAGIPYRRSVVTVTAFEEGDLNDVVSDPALDAAGGSEECPSTYDICNASSNNADFAYRLDFASTAIKYGGPSVGAVTMLNDIQIGDTTADAPVYLTKRDDETAPNRTPLPGTSPSVSTYGKTTDQATGDLAADGSGVDDQSYNFSGNIGVDYASNIATDRDAQRTLWVVPHYDVVGGSASYYNDRTRQASEALRGLLDDAIDTDTATEFLQNNGINLKGGQTVAGVGDFLMQFYGGYCSELFGLCAEVIALLPTGKKMPDAREQYYMTPGENGHFQLRFGLEASVRLIKYFRLGADFSYLFSMRGAEQKAAPFKGATIKNIGEGTEVNTSWNSLILRFTFDFQLAGFGLGFAYEGYSKKADTADLTTSTATDLYGNENQLDNFMLEIGTNTVAHKLIGDFFYVTDSGRFFFGISDVPAGHNVMKEREVHIGFVASF